MSDNYYQATGRPHAGLQNPAKFGLTHSQVVELIESGKWKSFYNSWWAREQREKGAATRRPYVRTSSPRKRKKFRCIACKTYYKIEDSHVRVAESVFICARCVDMLKRLT